MFSAQMIITYHNFDTCTRFSNPFFVIYFYNYFLHKRMPCVFMYVEISSTSLLVCCYCICLYVMAYTFFISLHSFKYLITVFQKHPAFPSKLFYLSTKNVIPIPWEYKNLTSITSIITNDNILTSQIRYHLIKTELHKHNNNKK